EIAQSECATGSPFVRYWMHNNMVTVNGVKMGKSLGNSVTLKDLFKKFHPVVIRFFILQSHYRSTLDFSDPALEAAKSGLSKLHETYNRLQAAAPGKGTIDYMPYAERFTDAMNDDFNSPIAISVLFDLAREVNSKLAVEGLSAETIQKGIALYETYGSEVLNILPAEAGSASNGVGTDALPKVMELVLDLRMNARKNKDFATSDKIRDRLKEAGIEVQDGKEGSTWKTI
ncbi:MAG: cysteine--tRNA ligase, partial [Chlorobiales bacterium]|nr:cysteine--tRNA ligase [Chlorobiales bacterium]